MTDVLLIKGSLDTEMDTHRMRATWRDPGRMPCKEWRDAAASLDHPVPLGVEEARKDPLWASEGVWPAHVFTSDFGSPDHETVFSSQCAVLCYGSPGGRHNNLHWLMGILCPQPGKGWHCCLLMWTWLIWQFRVVQSKISQNTNKNMPIKRIILSYQEEGVNVLRISCCDPITGVKGFWLSLRLKAAAFFNLSFAPCKYSQPYCHPLCPHFNIGWAWLRNGWCRGHGCVS